jgi:two-component system copper resistance phosphate regulon response regulator CusR
MRILAVDDDPKIRAFVGKGLNESGMQCETAPDGETALEMLRTRRFDLVLLDVMLPGLQGWDVLEALRREGNAVPVIWVTARDALEERVRGLRSGGDDYVVKPFDFAELVARIHAVLRRRA